MLPVELIRAKRDGRRLADADLRGFVAGVTDGSIPDYQVAAMLMAVYFRGMNDGELAAWADAMVRSGDVLDLEQKIVGCTLSKLAGAAFVKTSTGFGKGGATVEDIQLMRRVVGSEMGVKASGGVRTQEDALRMREAGATRIGASASVAIVTGNADPKAKGY